MNNRYFVPAAGIAFVAFMSFVLIVVVVVRPWGGPDRAWATHLNLTDEPVEGYTRSIQTFTSEDGEDPIVIWGLNACGESDVSFGKPTLSDIPQKSEACAEDPQAEWVAQGCAGCHGLDGYGGVVGPDLHELIRDDFSEQIRFGPGGMPAFSEQDLTDAHIALLSDFLTEIGGPPPTPTPIPPTVVPTATAIVAVESTSTPVSVITPTAESEPETGGDEELIAFGELLYQETAGTAGCAECHGVNAEGGGPGSSNAPAIKGTTRSKIKAALSNAYDMEDIELTLDELLALEAYLGLFTEAE